MIEEQRKKEKEEVKFLKILEKTNLGSFSKQSFYLAISFYSKMSFCHANISFKMFKDFLRQFQDKNKKNIADGTEKKKLSLQQNKNFQPCLSRPHSAGPSLHLWIHHHFPPKPLRSFRPHARFAFPETQQLHSHLKIMHLTFHLQTLFPQTFPSLLPPQHLSFFHTSVLPNPTHQTTSQAEPFYHILYFQ